MKFNRKYGEAATITFGVMAPGGDQLAQPVFAAGDVTISIDEAAAVNTTNLPTQVGQHFSLALTAAELTGQRITIRLEDQDATKVFRDLVLVAETYGDALAQNPLLDVAVSSRSVAGDEMALTVAESDALTDKVWDEGRSGHVAAGSFGEALDAKVSTRSKPGDGMTLTAAERTSLSNALLDLSNAIETGLTPRQALRLMTSIMGGLLNGAGTGTEVFKAAVSANKDRITAKVDDKGNRTNISVDLT